MNILQKTGAVLAIAGASVLSGCAVNTFRKADDSPVLSNTHKLFLGLFGYNEHYFMSVPREDLERRISEAAHYSENEESWYYDFDTQTLYEIGMHDTINYTISIGSFHRIISSNGGVYIHSHPSFEEDSIEDLLDIELKDLRGRINVYSRIIMSGNCEDVESAKCIKSEAESRLLVIEPYLKKRYFVSTCPSRRDLESSLVKSSGTQNTNILSGLGSYTDRGRFTYFALNECDNADTVIDAYLKKVYEYADSIERNNSNLDDSIKSFVDDVHSSFDGKIKLHVMTF